jgi:thiosulfate dehydrogenase [quinone] large subunit
MLGLLGIGLAMTLGIGLRVAAGAGALMMAFMWAAEWPIASGSSNPITDYHFIYAVVGIVLALTYAGHTWGLGRRWAALPIVQKNRWLI